MAKNWIKWPKGLTRKAKVLQIAGKLGVTRWQAAALCMEVWEWFDEYAENGHVPGVTIVTLASLPGHAGVAKAMADVGWILESGEGVAVPDLFRQHGDSATRRRSRLGRKRGNSGERRVETRGRIPSGNEVPHGR